MIIQNQQNNLGQVIVKAWLDPVFKEKLKMFPKKVMSEMGVETPMDIEIEVVENTAAKAYLTLPVAPSTDILSDVD